MSKRRIVWKQDNPTKILVDNFVPTEFLLKYMMPSTLGFGKEGEIVLHGDIGRLEVEDVMKSMTINAYMKFAVWFMEKSLKLWEEHHGKPKKCAKITIIFDLDGLKFKNAANTSSIDIFMKLIYLYQDRYQENLKEVYIINAPNYYIIVYSALKLAMSAEMVKQIHVFGRDQFQEKLLEIMDADILPAFLGGNRTDPDGNPRCPSFVAQAGPISERYFLTDEERYFKDRSQVKKLSIPKSSREEVIVDVPEKGATIHWEFLVESKEISFGLYQEISDDAVAEILPMEVYETSGGTESGSYKCQAAGRYILTFENSESWWDSREVEYCVYVQIA